MSLQIPDGTAETTTTEGTSDYVLAGNISQFRDFEDAITDGVFADGDRSILRVEEQSGADWEHFIGTYDSGTRTFTRDIILGSSNNGNKVNWGSGTKRIFAAVSGERGGITRLQYPIDAASNQALVIDGNERATPANNDEAYWSYRLTDSAGNLDEFARLRWLATDVTDGSEDGGFAFSTVKGGALSEELRVASDGVRIEQNWLFTSQSEAGVERLRLQALGANDPAELFLQAKGTANTSRITVTPDSSTANFSGITMEADSTDVIIDSIAQGNATAKPLVFKIDGAEAARFNTSGEFGIGADPSDTLHVKSGNGNLLLEATSTGSFNPAIKFDNGSTEWRLAVDNGDDIFLQNFITGNRAFNFETDTTAIWGNSTGIGIKDEAPDEVLVVNGNIGMGHASSVTNDRTIHGQNGFGTDKSGGNLTIAGGRGTGAGAGGAVILQAAAAGSTGSTLNALANVAEFGPGLDSKFNGAAHFGTEFDNGNSGASKTIDWTNGNKQKITIDADTTLSFTDPAGASSLILRVIQDGTGGHSVTLSGVRFPSGIAPTFSTAANAVDVASIYFDGTDYHVQTSLDFKQAA